MANRLVGSGQSNATVVCIKLLLTVFNFVFWVSNKHVSIGCVTKSPVVPYVAACPAFWFLNQQQWFLANVKAAKRIFNSDKICRSYSDLNFGVTFLEHSVYHTVLEKPSDGQLSEIF